MNKDNLNNEICTEEIQSSLKELANFISDNFYVILDFYPVMVPFFYGLIKSEDSGNESE